MNCAWKWRRIRATCDVIWSLSMPNLSLWTVPAASEFSPIDITCGIISGFVKNRKNRRILPKNCTIFSTDKILAGATSFGPISKSSAKRFIRETVDAEGQKVYQCLLCNMCTKHGNSIQRHMVIKHTKPSSHQCHVCHTSFPNKFYLTNHIATKSCMRNVMFDP